MAGEMEYVNPIIQAMVHTNQIMQQRAQLRQQVQEAKETKEIREHQLAQQMKQIENEHAHHQANLKLQTEAQALLAKKAKFDAIRETQKFHQETGGNPQALLEESGLAPEVDISNFASPERAAEIRGMNARAVSAGTAEGAAPTQIRIQENLFKNQTALQGQRDAAAAKRLETTQKHAVQLAELNHASAKRIADSHNAVQMAVAQTRVRDLESSFGDERLSQSIEGAWDAVFDPDKLSTKDERTAFDNALARRGELNSLPRGRAWKQYKDNLDNFANLQDLINEGRELAIGFSRDSPNAEGNVGYSTTGGWLGMVKPGSPLKARVDALKSKVDSAVRQLQGDKRISDKDAERIFGGFFDPASKKKENLDRIEGVIKIFQNSVKSSFPTMPKERMQSVLGKRGIVDFLPEEVKKEEEIEYVRDPTTGKWVRK